MSLMQGKLEIRIDYIGVTSLSYIIKKLEKDEFSNFVEIVVNAYPGFAGQTADFKERYKNSLIATQENNESIDFFGLFRDGKLLGGMRIHYFTMNLYGNLIHAGGVGLIAVDLLHKKEKVAKQLMDYFIAYFKERGTSILMLYPFRPDFYKQMGFGYGTNMNQYEISPSSFPKLKQKGKLLFLDSTHKDIVLSCANRYASTHHGMLLKTEHDMEQMFKNPEHKIVGIMENETLVGYILFTFKNVSKDNFLINNIIIKEFIYETPDALAQLCHFLHSQADQINKVILNTQDDTIEYLLSDPRNSSNHLIPSVYHETKKSGIGLMYKIIDVKTFFSQLPPQHFDNSSCKLGLIIHDSFQNLEPQKWLLKIEQGKLEIEEYLNDHPEIELEMDISDFSALALGSIHVNKLYQYGKLKISKPQYVYEVIKLFNRSQKPICTTAF